MACTDGYTAAVACKALGVGSKSKTELPYGCKGGDLEEYGIKVKIERRKRENKAQIIVVKVIVGQSVARAGQSATARSLSEEPAAHGL